MNWIKCEKELPQRSGLYLTYRKAFGVATCYYNLKDQCFTIPRITHWVDLPDPPEEELNDTIRNSN